MFREFLNTKYRLEQPSNFRKNNEHADPPPLFFAGESWEIVEKVEKGHVRISNRLFLLGGRLRVFVVFWGAF